MQRKLPVYVLIDTSGSMKGEPIESVKVGLESMLSGLRQNPYALETVSLSIITFDRDVRQILPMTPIEDLQMPELTTPDSGPTNTGEALQLLLKKMDSEIKKGSEEQKGDWMPLVFLMTDGKPSDVQLYNQIVPEVKKRKFGAFVACAAGMKANTDELKRLTDTVVALETTDSNSFDKFFKWVSNIVDSGYRSMGVTDTIPIPETPEEINILF